MEKKISGIDKKDVLLLKEGNKGAFNRIFREYNQKLYFFAIGYLKSEKDAEEVTQDTFLKLWERREYINTELSIHAYIFKIAFNFIQKKLIQKVKEEKLKHDLAGDLVNFDNHTSNLVNYHFLLEHINQLIDELPPRQKEVLELSKLKGFSTKEIAEQLSLATKTVEAHLTAALKFIRGKLSTEDFDSLLLFVLTFRKKMSID